MLILDDGVNGAKLCLREVRAEGLDAAQHVLHLTVLQRLNDLGFKYYGDELLSDGDSVGQTTFDRLTVDEKAWRRQKIYKAMTIH